MFSLAMGLQCEQGNPGCKCLHTAYPGVGLKGVVQPCTRCMSIPRVWSWGAGRSPCWVLEGRRALESCGLGARELGEQPGRSWEERGTPLQRVQEPQRMMNPWLLCGLSKVGVRLPAHLGHPKAAPRCWQQEEPRPRSSVEVEKEWVCGSCQGAVYTGTSGFQEEQLLQHPPKLP